MPVVAASQRGRPFLTSHCTPGRTVITRVNAKNTGPTIERIKYSPKVAAVAMVNTVKTTSPCVRVSPVRVTFGRSFAITACERLAAVSCDLRVCIANDRLDMCLSNHGQARTRIMALRVWTLALRSRLLRCCLCWHYDVAFAGTCVCKKASTTS